MQIIHKNLYIKWINSNKVHTKVCSLRPVLSNTVVTNHRYQLKLQFKLLLSLVTFHVLGNHMSSGHHTELCRYRTHPSPQKVLLGSLSQSIRGMFSHYHSQNNSLQSPFTPRNTQQRTGTLTWFKTPFFSKSILSYLTNSFYNSWFPGKARTRPPATAHLNKGAVIWAAWSLGFAACGPTP